MVVRGERMKERSKFLAADGFNVQLKKRRTSTDYFTVGGGERRKFARSCSGSGLGYFDSFSTANRKVVGARRSSEVTVTIQPTTYQKVRRIIEEHAERQARSSTSRAKVLPSSSTSSNTRSKSRELNNYTIVVSSRGENPRNNIRNGNLGFSSFSICEASSAAAARGSSTRGNPNPVGNCANNKNNNNNNNRGKSYNLNTKHPRLPSVSEDLKNREKINVRVNVLRDKGAKHLSWGPGSTEDYRDGYLVGQQRRLLSKLPRTLRQGNDRDLAGRISSESKTAQISQDYRIGTGLPESYRTDLRRSPSSTTLPSSWKKPARVGVKKSVSFSSDTSFQEKKSLICSKNHVHEAKVYHKGVLQDRASPSLGNLRDSVATSPSTTTTTTILTTPGGPSALVRAAREGNNVNLRQIMARAKTPQGSRELDINTIDASGRTAISYMAGNGAVGLLEAALSFPEIDVNLPDNEGNTPLHFAAQAGQLECVSILLQRCSGIEVDARNTLGFTPLMKAALQGRTKCAKILLFAGANPTLRDYGRGLRAEQWARYCGRYVCAEVIERFARHRLLERTTSCRWGSEPELAARVLQGKVTPMPTNLPPQSSGLRSKIRRVFRTSSGPDNRSFSLVSQLTSAALCASSPALPRPGEVPPVVKSLIRPLSVPQLRITLVSASAASDPMQPAVGTGYRSATGDSKFYSNFTENNIVSEKIESSSSVTKPPRSKKKNK